MDPFWPVEKLWPRRLLDTQTMTSLERQNGNVYGDAVEPRYSILSYTWGRWPEPKASALEVAGVSWRIPAVETRRFTAAAFRHVVRRMCEISGCRFAWVDVACIDQEDRAAKMDEVGRQAGIFANAERVFVWLWTLAPDALKAALADIVDATNFSLEPARRATLVATLETLLGDWWFSSLWTLQEGILRDDAVLLARDGAPIVKEDPSLYNLEHGHVHVKLFDLLLGIWSLSNAVLMDPEWDAEAADQVRGLIERTGYITGLSSNPNVHFGMATASRTATNELDNIYGIMSIYDLRVGAAAENPARGADREYTLAELAEEFAAALNAKSPMLAQMFVHAEPPRPGASWQITQRSRVPWDFIIWNEQYRTSEDFVIAAQPGVGVTITGSACPLASLFGAWKALNPGAGENGDEDGDVDDTNSSAYYFCVIPDDYLSTSHAGTIPARRPRRGLAYTPEQAHGGAAGLLAAFGSERVVVVRMGDRRVEGVAGSEEILGLILLREEDDGGGDPPQGPSCRRLGICAWAVNPPREQSVLEWTRFEGSFH